MNERTEYVEVVIKVPKPITEFYKTWLNFLGANETAKQYIADTLEDDLKSKTGQVIAEVCNSMFYDGRREVIKKYGLGPFLDSGDVGVDLEDECEDS